MARYEVRELTANALDDCGQLLADRHRRHKLAMPALDPKYADAEAARAEVTALLERDKSSGALVTAGGVAVAFVLGTTRPDPTWGPNVWIEDAGSAGTDPEAVREAYSAAAARWVAEGRTSHFVLAPASDDQLVEAWFSLGFGKQQVHAVREPVSKEFAPSLGERLIVRRVTRADAQALAELDVALPQHQSGSPVFSRLPVPTVEEALVEIETDLEDPSYTTFVAEYEGRIVGAATGCSLELSSGHTALMRPRSAGFLGFASVLPSARGLGAGRALGETVMCWSRDEGYEWVATDWRSTNLQANRSWTALGFRPSFHRLHRAIA